MAEPNLNSTIFQGGGSKDTLDIGQGGWKDGAGGLPDKDNLLNSSAVAYYNDAGELVVAIHADRYSFSGTVTNSGAATVYNVTVSDQGKRLHLRTVGCGPVQELPGGLHQPCRYVY